MTDARVWEAIKEMDESTGWPPAAIVDAVAEKLETDRDRVAQVWRERSFNIGAG